MPKSDPYTSALRDALAYVVAKEAILKEGGDALDAFDGVDVACELMQHAEAIAEGKALVYGKTGFRGDTLTSEAGFLAGYWQTTAMMQGDGDWYTINLRWFKHANAMLADELAWN